jgi:hypothetical protein
MNAHHNAHHNEIEARRHALAISIWENEGGTSSPELMDHQYGRHIEMDRPWRIYHVSRGAPARVNGNHRYIERRIKRISLSAPARPVSRETEAR